MFKIGDKVVYGKAGVCTVLDICKMPSPFGLDDDMNGDFYKLQPLYDKQNIIYISTNNEKIMMREVMSPEKADYLINNIDKYPPVYPKDERERRNFIKETLNCDDMSKWVELMNGLYREKQRRRRFRKTLRYKDEKIYNFLEDFIFGELAVSLGISKAQVFDYIEDKVSKLGKTKA